MNIGKIARITGFLLIVLAVFSDLTVAAEPKFDASAIEFFEAKVRPLLLEQCGSCHSGRKKRGNLHLDSRASLLKGGDTGPAIVPGEPDKSLLIKAIRYKDQLRMPPRSKLSDRQIADLTAWVKMGAPWPGSGTTSVGEEKIDFSKRLAHWSFRPVRTISPPGVKNIAWTRNPIDSFLLARLEASGLAPAESADRRTLFRRLTYDLTGLPPTPEEMADFLADHSPGAYEKAVDRLLASPAYGERWGRHWLDLVRFAETSGHEFDFEIANAHGYRDYVIRAFNDDVRYDQFVQEHIAGDLMPQPRRHPADRTNESILGTGFWFLGESKHSPVDLRGDGADRRDNMIDVFGKAFVGLTLACARCHDHKFDPIRTREYYSLVSYIQSSRMQQAFLDPPERIRIPARRIHNLRRAAATLAITITAKELESRLARLSDELLQVRQGKKSPIATALARDELFRPWSILGKPGMNATQFAAKKRDLFAKQARDADATPLAASVFEDFSHGDYRGWFVTGDAFTAPAGSTDVEIQPGQPLPVRRLYRGAHSGLVSGRLQGALRSRTFTIDRKYILYHLRGRGVRFNLIIDGFQQIRNPIYGGLAFTVNNDKPHWHAQDVSMWLGLKAYVEVLDDGDGQVELDRIVFSDNTSPPPEPANPLLVAGVEKAQSAEELAAGYEKLLLETVHLWRQGKLTGGDRLALLDAMLTSPVIAALPASAADDHRDLEKLLRQAAELERALPQPRRGLAIADGSGVNERVHIRGNHRTLGEEAPRQLPAALVGDRQPPATDRSGRLEMAQRLTSSDNPLFARVLVNRLWHHHFGAGIVRSTDDFGHQGERPTHPELLDWLASEFIRSGWSIKHMHRLMVLSSAYRMASRNEAGEAADPRNLLLHRMPIRRLEAEAIRDAMLAVSGQLDRTMFGRGPLPHLTEFMIGRGRPKSGPLDGDGRRSLYLNVRRNFLNPMFLAFDYPVPFTCIGRRSVSNVPAQALTLLNNPFVTQQARRWAEQVLNEPGKSDEQRITAMYERAFGRPPDSTECREAIEFLVAQGREYGRLDVRAWADLAHVLFNVKEFIFVN